MSKADQFRHKLEEPAAGDAGNGRAQCTVHLPRHRPKRNGVALRVHRRDAMLPNVA